MDVKMPDGTVITNVPETTTQDQLIKMVRNAKLLRVTPEKIDPTDGMSTTEKFFAGAGKGMTDLARGAGQALRGGIEVFDKPTKTMSDLITGSRGHSFADTIGLPSQRDIDNAKSLDAPLMNTGAGNIGNVVGQAALAAPTAFIPGANTVLGSSLIGAGLGAIQPTATGESTLKNAALGAVGGAVGAKVGNALNRALKGSTATNAAKATASSTGGKASSSATVTGGATATGSGGGYNYGSVGEDLSAGLNAAKESALKTGKDLGFKSTPGQSSGSRALQQLEAKLESQPMTSGTFNEIKSHNQTVLNRIAARSIGEDAPVVDAAVLGNAQDRISGIYKLVADGRLRNINPDDFLTSLGAIESKYEGMLPVNISENPLVKRLFKYAESGGATGKQLQDLASKIGKVANNNMTSASGDRQVGMALFEVKEHVDDLLEKGLKGETLKKFTTARKEYRNLMLLTQRQGVVNPSSGDVSGNALASLLQSKDRSGFLFGKNNSDLYNAARFSQAFKPIVGDSGTATRMPLPSPTDFVLSLPFSLATKAYTSSPVVNLAASAGSISKNGIAPALPQKYLPNALGLLGGAFGS